MHLTLVHLTDPSPDAHYDGSLMARVVSPGTYTLSDLADDITFSCSLTRADVIGCMEAMTHHIRVALAEGRIVQLDGFGRLRVNARSDLCTPAEASRRGFSPATLVRAYHVTFQADKSLVPQAPT